MNRPKLGKQLAKYSGFYLFLSLVTVPVWFLKLHANDLWKALYTGRYLTLFSAFPHHSTFTFSPVVEHVPRDAYSWMGNLLFIGLYNGTGLTGLWLLRLAFLVFVFVVLHAIVRFRTHPFILLLFVVSAYTLQQKIAVRTALFELPLTILLVGLWYRVVYQNLNRWMYALPVLLVVWANLHGSYLIGWCLWAVMVTGLWLDAWCNQARLSKVQRLKMTGMILATMVLVIVVKPYPDTTLPGRLSGLAEKPVTVGTLTTSIDRPENPGSNAESYGFSGLFRSLIVEERHHYADEFEPPLTKTNFLFVKSMIVLGFIVLVLIPIGSSWTPGEYLLLATVGVLTLATLRTVAYLPLVGVPLVLHHLANDPGYDRLLSLESGLANLTVLAVVGGSLAAFIVQKPLMHLTGIPIHTLGTGPTKQFTSTIPEEVLHRYPRQRVANTANTGAFLIWKWWPYKRVFIDTKTNAYQPGFLNDSALRDGIQRHKLNILIMEWFHPDLPRMRKSNRWKVLFDDPGMSVLQHH